MGRHAASCHRIQPTGQPGVFIGKQGHQARITGRKNSQPLQKCLPGLRVLLKGATTLQHIGFAQQAAGPCVKPWKEEHPLQSIGPHGRQAVTTADPVFGAQVLEVDPQCRRCTGLHRLQIAFRQFAGEGLDHHVSDIGRLPLLWPLAHLDPLLPLARSIDIRLGAQRHERPQIIDPQPHALLMFGHQLPGQAPGHTNVAVVIDHTAKNIPGGFHSGLQHSKG